MIKEFKVFSNLFFSSLFGPSRKNHPSVTQFLFLCNAISHPPPLSSSASSFPNSNSSRGRGGGREEQSRRTQTEAAKTSSQLEEKKIGLGEGPHTYVLGLSRREREKRGGWVSEKRKQFGRNEWEERRGGWGHQNEASLSPPTHFPFPRWKCSQPGTSQAGFFLQEGPFNSRHLRNGHFYSPVAHKRQKRPTPTCRPAQTEIRQRTRRSLEKGVFRSPRILHEMGNWRKGERSIWATSSNVKRSTASKHLHDTISQVFLRERMYDTGGYAYVSKER